MTSMAVESKEDPVVYGTDEINPLHSILKSAKQLTSWDEFDAVLGTASYKTLSDIKVFIPLEIDQEFNVSMNNYASLFTSNFGPEETPHTISFGDLNTAAEAAGWKPCVIHPTESPSASPLLTQFGNPIPCSLFTYGNIDEICKQGRFDLVLAAVRSGFGIDFDDSGPEVFSVLECFLIDFPASIEALATHVLPAAMRRIQLKGVTWEKIAHESSEEDSDIYVRVIESCGFDVDCRYSWMLDRQGSPRGAYNK